LTARQVTFSSEYFRLLDSRFCAHDQKHRRRASSQEKRESEFRVLCCLELHFLLIVVCLTSHTSVFIWRLFHSDANTERVVVADYNSRGLKSLSKLRENFHNQLICEFDFFLEFLFEVNIIKMFFFRCPRVKLLCEITPLKHNAGV
jgi:hypothetical protein